MFLCTLCLNLHCVLHIVLYILSNTKSMMNMSLKTCPYVILSKNMFLCYSVVFALCLSHVIPSKSGSPLYP